MSIFNNEEIDKLRNEVQALRQQVADLHNALDNIGQSQSPPGTTPHQEAADKPTAGTETDRPESGMPTAEPVTAKPETLKPEKPAPGKPEPTGAQPPADVADSLQAMAGKLNILSEKIDTAVYQEKIIRDMHQELMQLKKGLIEDLKKDYLTDILNICERMGDTDRHIRPDAPDYDADKAKQLVTNTYLYIRDHLSDQYSVEYFEPAVGDAYEPKAHRAIRVIETDEDDKAGTVAECLTGGFRNSETGRVLRQARIAVYKKSR